MPIDETVAFEAADKYLRVLTRDDEALVRMPLKTLLERLPPDEFRQIHRGTVVRVREIGRTTRTLSGRIAQYSAADGGRTQRVRCDKRDCRAAPDRTDRIGLMISGNLQTSPLKDAVRQRCQRSTDPSRRQGPIPDSKDRFKSVRCRVRGAVGKGKGV